MGDHADLRFQWAMRRTTWTPAQASDLVHALADAVEDACAAHFPESAGYRTSTTHFHGLLDGVRVCVSKGEFSAVVSTQCYREVEPRREQLAVRLVAAVREAKPQPVVSVFGLLEVARPVVLLVVGSALVFALISAFASPGLGSYFRLSLWMSFMIMMAPAIAWMLGARTSMQLEAIEATRTACLSQAHAQAEHESRWRQLVHAMQDQQTLVLQRRALPFRR